MKEQQLRKTVREEIARELNELRRVNAKTMESRGTAISEAYPPKVANEVGQWLREDLSAKMYWFTDEDHPWSAFWSDAPFREEKTVEADGKEYVLGYVYGGMPVVLERGAGAGVRVWLDRSTKERAEMDFLEDYVDDFAMDYMA